MAVFRIEKTKDYTIMSNHHLKNRELSLKAKGLLWRYRMRWRNVCIACTAMKRTGETKSGITRHITRLMLTTALRRLFWNMFRRRRICT